MSKVFLSLLPPIQVYTGTVYTWYDWSLHRQVSFDTPCSLLAATGGGASVAVARLLKPAKWVFGTVSRHGS